MFDMKMLNRQKNRLVFLLLTIVSLPVIIHAQSPLSGLPSGMKVSQLTDQQMLQLWQEAQKNGLSENDAIKLLAKKGLGGSEINNFKRRLLDIQNTSRFNKSGSLNLVQDTASFMRDSSWVAEVPQIRKKINIYGLDFFSNPNLSFEPNLRIATPENYILGPDDELIINVTGLNETSIQKRVTPDGTVQLPYAGIINVNGLNIKEATKLIRARLQERVYPALKTGRAQLFVTLGNVKTIRVTILGEAERPGGYSVSSLSSFFNVLYLSGGPTERGSLRNIEIIRNNKVYATIDLYPFLQKGILEKDIRLEDQDIIRFPVYTKHVYLTGEIKRPAIYELAPKETLADLIQLGGGFGDTAYKELVKVVQLSEKGLKNKDIPFGEFNYYLPHNGDSVFIEKIIPVFPNRVMITGAVNYPGNYEWTEGMFLLDLVKKADSLREHALPERGFIKRRAADNTRSLLSFNLNQILTGKAPDIMLAKDDSVFIPFADSLQNQLTITIAGFVRNPGSFLYRQGMSVSDAVLMAGGFSYDAAQHRIEISRLNKNRSDTLANQLVDIIRIDLDSTDIARNKHPFQLQPLDYINVPRLLNYHSIGNVKIRGEVLFPGDFILERRDENVLDLIKRAGGLTPYGSMGNLQVYRKGLRVSVDFLREEQKDELFLLQQNDSIYIPRIEPFVEIKGAVFNAQIVNYKSSHFLYYISSAGGITDKGYLKKAYVQYSNGINRKTRYFLFFRKYPKILPGSKIIVPEGGGTGLLKSSLALPELLSILSAITTLVTILKLR